MAKARTSYYLNTREDTDRFDEAIADGQRRYEKGKRYLQADRENRLRRITGTTDKNSMKTAAVEQKRKKKENLEKTASELRKAMSGGSSGGSGGYGSFGGSKRLKSTR